MMSCLSSNVDDEAADIMGCMYYHTSQANLPTSYIYLDFSSNLATTRKTTSELMICRVPLDS